MEVDAVVLDVDGVLVDVEDSYRRAIVESIERVYGETIDRDQVQMFKNAGGFNNDWELTYAAALYRLAHERGLTDGLQSFTDKIALNEGGLGAAVSVVEETLDEETMTEVRNEWNKERLRDVFQQLYLGEDLVVTMDDWDGGKPEPDALIRLADRLGVDSLLYIGDSLDDVETAVNANREDGDRSYHAVGVLSGGLSGEEGRTEFEIKGADEVVDDVNELPEVLEGEA